MADLGSAFIGAGVALATAIISGYGLENYRRHKDRQGIASALYGEISALMNITRENDVVAALKQLISEIEANVNFPLGSISTPIANVNPVFDKLADKIGLLSYDTPEYLARFYNGLMGYRKTFSELYMGSYDKYPDKRLAALRSIVKIAEESERISGILLPKLLDASNKRWLKSPWSRRQAQVEQIK